MKIFNFFAALCLVVGLSITSSAQTSERIILVTLDGLRWQELFTGADEFLVKNKDFHGSEDLAKNYWRNTPEERRKIIAPFVWEHVAKTGVIHGNRLKNSKVDVSNHMWFSYPGYNEILTGAADDTHITSNDKVYNPNKTILEKLNENPKYKGSVAAFCGWDVFPYIINEKRSGVPVNAGFNGVAQGENLSEIEQFLNANSTHFPDIWSGSVRFDALTQGYAMAYMKRAHPKVVYISFAETDDFAHEGNYGLYLASAKAADSFLKQLWDFTQKDPFYKGKTTFIVTVDHGRGLLEKWTSHGNKIEGANETWLIMYGAGVAAQGEIAKDKQIYSTQVVKEIQKLLKL